MPLFGSLLLTTITNTMPIIISDDEDEVQVVTKSVERPQIERDDEVHPRKRTRLAPDDSSQRASASSSRITRASHTKTVAPSATLTTPPDPTINVNSATQDPPNNPAVADAPTTEQVTSTKPKTQKSRAKKTTTRGAAADADLLNADRTESASGLVSGLVEKFLKKESDLSGLLGRDAAALSQLLDRQQSTFEAQRALFDAQKAVFEAQKEASEAWREAEDAKLKTLTYAKENDLPLQYSGQTTKPVESRTVMQPVQPPQQMHPIQPPQQMQPVQPPQQIIQYTAGYPQPFPMQQYQGYAPAPAPTPSTSNQYVSISAPPGA